MRVNRVKRAAKPQGTCESCHKLIEAGSAYSWIKPRYGPKRSRHASCASFRPSDLTSNDKLSQLYAAQESIEDAMRAWEAADSDDLSDLVSALNDAAEQAREVAGMYNEAAENIESGFGHATSQSEELQDNGSQCEDWADQLETLAIDLDSSTYSDAADVTQQIEDAVGALSL